MRTLVIDTASEACSVALFEQDQLVDGSWAMLGRGHAEQLIPMIAALDGRGRATRIAVARGPGSFTGVRVGVAAARALALAWDATLYGYSTPALIAAMAHETFPHQPLHVTMTGGHGQWFMQAFDDGGRAVSAVSSIDPDAACREMTENLIAGSVAETAVTMRGWGEAITLWPDARKFTLLNPAALTSDVSPLYGRPPDAKISARS